jgi:hypothetical protein
MFPKVKLSMKMFHFESLEDIQGNVTILKGLWEIISSNVSRHDNWNACIKSEGEWFEGVYAL